MGIPRARINPESDVVLVTGSKERLAQCVVKQLSTNAKSEGVAILPVLPGSCFQGIQNPRDVRDPELVYPDQPLIDTLGTYENTKVVNADSGVAYKEALASATALVISEESAPALLAATKDVLALLKDMPRLKRVVLASHIGVERRTEDMWKLFNRKTFRGGAPLDKWFEAEEALVEASEGASWTYTVIRTGDLRGNGPLSVVYGDTMLTLVDNAFDVSHQDVAIEKGDEFDIKEFTKRQSAAAVMNRMLTSTQNKVLNKKFSVVSVGPVDRDRRKGWDVAKGKSPPEVQDKDIDEELAEKGEEAPVPEGAPVPT